MEGEGHGGHSRIQEHGLVRSGMSGALGPARLEVGKLPREDDRVSASAYVSFTVTVFAGSPCRRT